MSEVPKLRSAQREALIGAYAPSAITIADRLKVEISQHDFRQLLEMTYNAGVLAGLLWDDEPQQEA